MKNYILIGIIILLVTMFVVLGISKSIMPFLDPRYILLIIIIALGTLFFIFGILVFKEKSLRRNILGIILSIITGTFEFTSFFAILFGLFLLLAGIIGLIKGANTLDLPL